MIYWDFNGKMKLRRIDEEKSPERSEEKNRRKFLCNVHLFNNDSNHSSHNIRLAQRGSRIRKEDTHLDSRMHEQKLTPNMGTLSNISHRLVWNHNMECSMDHKLEHKGEDSTRIEHIYVENL